MKRWGVSPWDNRAAASWMVGVNESGNPVAGIRDALHLDVAEYAEEVRAAAALLVVMIEAGRWPAGCVETALELAISRLQEIGDKRVMGDDPRMAASIGEEIRALRSRLLAGPARASA